MDNINPIIFEKAKKIIDRMDEDQVYQYLRPGTYVIVRDDAKTFTDDWVDTMDMFIGERCYITEVRSNSPLIEIDFNNNDYYFNFHYKSLIPIKLIEELSKPIYSPKKLIFEAKELEYYNIIKKKRTKWKFRFKTKDEFKNEFGPDWREEVPYGWVKIMDENFGENVQGVTILHDRTTVEIDECTYAAETMTPNRLAHPSYKPKNLVYENADLIIIDGYNLSNWDEDAIPFVASTYFDVKIGENGIKHTEMFMDGVEDSFREDYYVNPKEYEEKFGEKPMNPISIEEIENFYEGQAIYSDYFEDIWEEDVYSEVMSWDYIGRLWTESKVISFWKYPKNIDDLKKIVEALEKETHLKIWNNGWKILVIKVLHKIDDNGQIISDVTDTTGLIYDRDEQGIIDSEDNQYASNDYLIPIEEYKQSLNPPEKDFKEHIKSPLEKKHKNPIKGIGSDKKLSGSLPGELPVETRHRLYQESKSDLRSEYLTRLANLPFNCFFLSQTVIDDEKMNKVIDFLEICGVSNLYRLLKWKTLTNQAYLITLDGNFQSMIKDFNVYQTTQDTLKDFISNNSSYKSPQNKIMNIIELYQFIQINIIHNSTIMYQPRNIIRENIGVMAYKQYLNKEKELPFNTIVYSLHKDEPSAIRKLKELAIILNDLKFTWVEEAVNDLISSSTNDTFVLVLHSSEINHLDKGRIYTTDKDNTRNLKGTYPNMEQRYFYDIDNILKLFKNLTTMIPSYKPRNIIRESIRKLKDF